MAQIISNISLVLPGEILPDQELMIDKGSILDYGKTGSFFGTKLDGQGGFLMPGFIDLHVHGAQGSHFFDPGGKEKILAYHLEGGTTGLLATTISGELEQWNITADLVNTGQEKQPHIIGIHMEGPLINPRKAGIHRGNRLGTVLLQDVQDFIIKNPHQVKVITVAPELPGIDSFISWAYSQGIVISAGHSLAGQGDIDETVRKYITRGTHLFNAMESFHHRNPGIVGECLLNDNITAEVIADGVHLHPDTLRLILRVKGYDKVSLVTDAVALSGLVRYSGGYMGNQKVWLRKNGVYDEKGNLAGSTLTMIQAVKNMVRFTGCSLWQAVYMASSGPARTLRIWDQVGSIKKGKQADLVLTDQHLNIKKIWIRGQVACTVKKM